MTRLSAMYRVPLLGTKSGLLQNPDCPKSGPAAAVQSPMGETKLGLLQNPNPPPACPLAQRQRRRPGAWSTLRTLPQPSPKARAQRYGVFRGAGSPRHRGDSSPREDAPGGLGEGSGQRRGQGPLHPGPGCTVHEHRSGRPDQVNSPRHCPGLALAIPGTASPGWHPRGPGE